MKGMARRSSARRLVAAVIALPRRASEKWLPALLIAVSSTTAVKADRLYVSFWSEGAIKFYDTTTSSPTATTFASGLSGPNYLTVDSATNLLATMYQSPYFAVERFTPEGVRSVFATNLLETPNGLAFDAMGNLFVANQSPGTVVRFTPDGVGMNWLQSLNTPTAVALDSSGNLYVSQHGGVDVYSPDGTYMESLYPGGAVWGLAFDNAGNLFASLFEQDLIRKYSPTGSTNEWSDFAAGLDGPLGLAFDSAGNLYVANSGNKTVEKITAAGVRTVFATTTTTPSFVAVAPTPAVLPPSLAGIAMYSGLTITGSVGTACSVQATADVGPNPTWTTIASFALPTSPYLFMDTNSPAYPRRFYRLTTP